MVANFRVPEGARQGRFKAGHFDPNFGLGPPPKSNLENQVILEKANKWLNSYGYENIRKDEIRKDPDYISSEVGDDEETVSNSKPFVALQLVFHELYGMVISKSDTTISSRYGNFAEDLIILPDGYGQTYLRTRKTGTFSDMSFIDIPKLRLAIDIRPMRMDHSATNDGKASMIGARQRWIPTDSPLRGQYEIFNLFQDINLGLHRDKKFPYLPSFLGGYGKEPPFRQYRNFERFLKAFKQGSHSELIRELVNRTIDFVGKTIDGEYPAKDPLLSHMVRFQSSFHDWVKGRTIYAPVTWFDVPPEVGKFQAAKFGESSVKDDVITRLVAEGKLLTEQKLEIAVEHNELCKALLGSTNILEFKKIRDEARSRFNNFSIFSLENYGMIKEITLNRDGKSSRPLRSIDVNLFYDLVNKGRYNLRGLLAEESVYYPEAMNEIYERGPMKVNFTFSPRNKVGTRSFAAQRHEYSHDYEDTEEIGALDNLESWLREGCKGPVPTIIINDDESIIQACANQAYNIIVTDDIRLCRKANRVTGNVIFRVDCAWYYQVLYFDYEKTWSSHLEKFFPGKSWVEHIDTGSIKSFEENNFLDGSLLSKPFVQKFNIWKKIDQKDQLIAEDAFGQYHAVTHGKLFDYRNLAKSRASRRSGVPTPSKRR